GLGAEFLLLGDEQRRLQLIVGGLGIFPEGARRARPLLERQLLPQPRRGQRRLGHCCYSSHMRRGTIRASTTLVAVVLAGTLAAQQRPGIHPISGRRIAPVMGYQGAEWLERVERVEEEEPELALNVLQIRKGASVADIG